jgi:predicted Zn-dependent protease
MNVGRSLAVCVLAVIATVSVDATAQFGQIGDLAKGAMNKPKLTDEDESRLAQLSAEQFEAKNKMWPDPLLDTYLGGVMQKVVAASAPRPYAYRLRVVSDPTLNAFTFGGGLVYMHAGLVARLENEAQLVMVLAHEVAHVTERHVTKGIEKAYNTNLLGKIVTTGAGATGILPNSPLVGFAYDHSMSAAINGHGRELERDADLKGIEAMVKAGYDPREAPITFELLLMEYGDQGRLKNFFYGSHPSNQERFKTLSDLAKNKYGKVVSSTKLAVNSEEFKRATRRVVIAVGVNDYEGKRFNSSKAMFEKAVRAFQGDPAPHYYLGRIALETTADMDKAIAHLEAAIAADATYAPPHRELGLAYYRKGDRAKAVAELEKYLALDPKAKDADQIKTTIEEIKR